MKKRSRSSTGSRWIGCREPLPIFHPARRVMEFHNLVRVRRQIACGGRIVALGPRIDAHAPRQRCGFLRVGVERPEKVDDAKRPNPHDEDSLRRRCFLPRPDKNILAALALIRASETNVGDNPLPEIVGCPSNGAGRQFHHDRPVTWIDPERQCCKEWSHSA